MSTASEEVQHLAGDALEQLRALHREARLRAYLSSPTRLYSWKELEPAIGEVERAAQRAPATALTAIRAAVQRLVEFLGPL